MFGNKNPCNCPNTISIYACCRPQSNEGIWMISQSPRGRHLMIWKGMSIGLGLVCSHQIIPGLYAKSSGVSRQGQVCQSGYSRTRLRCAGALRNTRYSRRTEFALEEALSVGGHAAELAPVNPHTITTCPRVVRLWASICRTYTGY